MPYTVIESACVPKQSSEKTTSGDDVLHLTPHFAAVIDGAGTWSGRIGGYSPGRFAALAVAEGLDSLDPSATLGEAARHLSQSLRAALATAPVEGKLTRPPTCVAAIYSAARREIWLVGDCQALVGGRHFQHHLPTDERATAFRQAYLRGLLAGGAIVSELQAADPSWPLIRPLFEAAPVFQNRSDADLGYGAFDGQDVPGEHLYRIAIPVEVHEIVLASDGYPVLKPTLAESEALLWRLASEDPLMIGDYPGTRSFPSQTDSFDDRTYLRLRLD